MSTLILAAIALPPAAPPVSLLGESRPAAKRLADARELAASGKVDEAVAGLLALIESGDSELIPLPDGRLVRTRTLAQAAAAALPPEGLAAYRKQLTARARKWVAAGEFRRAADEAFCTEPALLALGRLGDQAFLAGRLDEAEAWWSRIAPLERGSAGPARLAFPGPPAAEAARARAKQLLARLHAGRPDWAAQLAAFERLHPKASGRLAGHEGLYADALRKAAKALRPAAPSADWPAFGGGPSRGRIARAGRPLELLARLCRGGPTWRVDLATRGPARRAFAPPDRSEAFEAARRLPFHPVVVGQLALVADGRFITSYRLKDGKRETLFDFAGAFPAAKRLPLPAEPGLSHTLAVSDGLVFARLGTPSGRDVRPKDGEGRPLGDSALVCVALAEGPDGLRRHWAVRSADEGRKVYALFEGAPLVAHGRAYIAVTRYEEDRAVTSIHCYPARLGSGPPALLWKADVCEARELAASTQPRARHNLLTLAGPNVVYCSHSGVVVALDAATGERAWAVRYPRREEEDEAPRLEALAPCLHAEGRLYVAPADSARLLCLSPLTGRTLWQRDSLNVVQLLGVGKGRLIFSTWRGPAEGSTGAGGLRAVMADTGGDRGGWVVPADEKGLLPFGRGQLVGGVVLWPTARRPFGVIAARQEDGAQPDNPTLLHRVPSGNLVLAGGALVVADGRQLQAFAPEDD